MGKIAQVIFRNIKMLVCVCLDLFINIFMLYKKCGLQLIISDVMYLSYCKIKFQNQCQFKIGNA